MLTDIVAKFKASRMDVAEFIMAQDDSAEFIRALKALMALKLWEANRNAESHGMPR